MHGFISGIVDDISPAETVTLMHLIEEETIRMAKEKGYSKLITTNTSPLTRVRVKRLYIQYLLVDCNS